MMNWRWVSWLILSIGFLIVGGGVAIGYGGWNLVANGKSATAEVVELRLANRQYAPILQFPVANGGRHEVRDIAKGAPDVAIGDYQNIFYRPQDPDDFQIDTFARLWLPALLLAGFGAVWMLLGLLISTLSRIARSF
jgi:hypothetical protein